jgi:hypothetical protein
MADDYDKRYVEPIVNASRPATLAALSLAVLRFSAEDPMPLQVILLVGAIMFLFSSFFIFFYSIYPTRRILWTGTAMTFFLGLLCSIMSSVILLLLV